MVASGEMRKIRYGVAISLDGYIADRQGGYDWIVQDPEIDFAAMFARYDTLLMGRKTFDLMRQLGEADARTQGVSIVVVSRTLSPRDHPKATILSDDWQAKVQALRETAGKDIWLFGGGEMFRSMLDAGLVDGVNVGIIPVLLGGGIPFLPPPSPMAKLRLVKHGVYEKSGIVRLEYDVVRPDSDARPRR